jgi:hypothetical protein
MVCVNKLRDCRIAMPAEVDEEDGVINSKHEVSWLDVTMDVVLSM